MPFVQVTPAISATIDNTFREEWKRRIVARCVWGYSEPSNLLDRIEKIRYRLSEWWKGYSDWNASCEILGQRTSKTLDACEKSPFFPQGGGILVTLIKENNGPSPRMHKC